MLRTKSLTQLRAIAQSFDVKDIFQKDANRLVQDIELRQQQMAPIPHIELPKPEYDARLMSKPPAKVVNLDMANELLHPLIMRGLHFEIDGNGERWKMRCGIKTDEGTMRMNPNTLVRCAQRLMA